MEGFQLYLVVVTAVACGLVGGVFYAFSTFVMAGLDRLLPEQGMAAMRSINVTAMKPGLMVPFFGTMVACLAVAVSAIVSWDDTVSVWLLAGAALYVVGTFVMTGLYHVPRNNRLAATNPAAPEARDVWGRYLIEWTRGNHVRTGASLAAALALTFAVHLG
jgi:uncharacterized membrane protein